MARSALGCRRAALVLTAGALLVMPQAALARETTDAAKALAGLSALAPCGREETALGSERPHLEMVLDRRGWLSGHRLRVASNAPMALGRTAFLDGPFGDQYVVGDALAGRTQLIILDAQRGCAAATVLVAGLVFRTALDPTGTWIYHDLVDPDSRRELGIWRVRSHGGGAAERVLAGLPPDHPAGPIWVNSFAWSPDGDLAAQSCGAMSCVTRIVDEASHLEDVVSGVDQGMIVGLTGADLVTMDGGCTVQPCPLVTFARGAQPGPLVDDPIPQTNPAPVPESEPDIWSPDGTLHYRWSSWEPEGFMRSAINAAAEDIRTSRNSRAALFNYGSDAAATIGLTTSMDGNCERAIACAYRNIPDWWYIRLRPHRSEVNWGTVRWCEAQSDPQAGCYEIEHTMIHEFGHVEGLDHSNGLGLSAWQSVMDPRLVQYPDAGWSMHHLGPCDQATLQRRYDVANAHATMAHCGRLETSLSIAASDYAVRVQQSVTLSAVLRVRDRSSYGKLGGNALSGRRVLIQRRSDGGPWIGYTATQGAAPGTYSLVFKPSATYQFRAVLEQPSEDGLMGAVSDVITVAIDRCPMHACPATVVPAMRVQ